MNLLGNTPPNGDFVRLVDQLVAEAAQRALRPGGSGGPAVLNVGMEPSSAPAVGVFGDRAAQRPGSAEEEASSDMALDAAVAPQLPVVAPGAMRVVQALALIWGLALAVMLFVGAPASAMIAVVFIGLWAARGLKRLLLPKGMQSWRQFFALYAQSIKKS